MREEENREGGKWTKRAPREPKELMSEKEGLYGKEKLGKRKQSPLVGEV